MNCPERLCLCRSTTEWTIRRFFSLWDASIPSQEERDWTIRAQQETGVNYLEVMVDDIPDT